MMRAQVAEIRTRQPAQGALELTKALAAKIALNTPSQGLHATAIDALVLYRKDDPSPCYPANYELSVHVFTQGQKRVTLGGSTYLCKPSTFLLSSIDVPVVSQVIEASSAKPLLSFVLKLDLAMVREILAKGEFHNTNATSMDRALALGDAREDLLQPCLRLIDLLDAPQDIPFLSKLIESEIVYRLLRGPKGERLCAIATLGAQSHKTANAVAWLRTNYKKPLSLEELANVANMGTSTLHHHFRALTAMSPCNTKSNFGWLRRERECWLEASMPRVRRLKSDMRARASSTASTNDSSDNHR
jgi:AraC-like DNA-binding protein